MQELSGKQVTLVFFVSGDHQGGIASIKGELKYNTIIIHAIAVLNISNMDSIHFYPFNTLPNLQLLIGNIELYSEKFESYLYMLVLPVLLQISIGRN